MPLCTYAIPELPPQQDLETIPVLRALKNAHRNLAELKGRAAVIPNQGILIDTLSLQEAKASSEIENIVTTQDELFRTEAALLAEGLQSGDAKEVALYRDALKSGYDAMLSKDGLISNNVIVEMFRVLKGYDGGFRQGPGHVLRHDRTGETVYVPPQLGPDIIRHMTKFEAFINDRSAADLGPLLKMALIHPSALGLPGSKASSRGHSRPTICASGLTP